MFIQSSFITQFFVLGEWPIITFTLPHMENQGCGIQNMSQILLPFRTDPDRPKQIQTFQAATVGGTWQTRQKMFLVENTAKQELTKETPPNQKHT